MMKGSVNRQAGAREPAQRAGFLFVYIAYNDLHGSCHKDKIPVTMDRTVFAPIVFTR